MSASILVGDKETDIEAGIAAGVGTNILVRSGHPIDEEHTKAQFIVNSFSKITGIENLIHDNTFYSN